MIESIFENFRLLSSLITLMICFYVFYSIHKQLENFRSEIETMKKQIAQAPTQNDTKTTQLLNIYNELSPIEQEKLIDYAETLQRAKK